MTWATPRTWTTGDDVTAARLNQDLRDNPLFLYNAPGCRVTNSAQISITTGGTGTALTFDTERYDVDTMHSTSVNTGRMTATTAGKYILGGHIAWNNTSTTGIRQVQVRLNGATLVAVDSMTGSSDQQDTVTAYSLAATDYAEIVAFQNSGGSLNVTKSGNYSPEAWAAWVAA